MSVAWQRRVVDMSVAWQRRVVAWAHATYQYHVNEMDTVGQSVGRSVDARYPVDFRCPAVGSTNQISERFT